MLISRTDLFDLMTGLQSGAGVVGGPKYTYATAKTRRAIKPLVEEIQKKHKELLAGYEKEMHALAIKYAQKDPSGNPTVQMGRTMINPVFKADWEKEKEEINTEWKEQLDAKDAFMDEEIEVNIHKIPESEFPAMQDNVADLLFPMREEV